MSSALAPAAPAPRAPPRAPPRRARSVLRVHYDLPRPPRVALEPYAAQVAGHRGCGDRYIGLLKSPEGHVLKPLRGGRREAELYTRLWSPGPGPGPSPDPGLRGLRAFAPKYYGCRNLEFGGVAAEYLCLEDLTAGMQEPCVMDVKIGRRTWDPLATADKIRAEQAKYAECKREFGFCIPGYQVYSLSSGRLARFGKDHGKRLQGAAVVDALRGFTSCALGRPCRALLVRLLARAWRLRGWAASARPLRLYGASVLLLADAARTRCCRHEPSSAAPAPAPPAPAAPAPNAWGAALDRLRALHSFEHNYEEKLAELRLEYRLALGRLGGGGGDGGDGGEDQGEGEGEDGGGVRLHLVDFAHAFFTEEESVDDNFLEGVDGLVGVLERLLRETDDQVT